MYFRPEEPGQASPMKENDTEDEEVHQTTPQPAPRIQRIKLTR